MWNVKTLFPDQLPRWETSGGKKDPRVNNSALKNLSHRTLTMQPPSISEGRRFTLGSMCVPSVPPLPVHNHAAACKKYQEGDATCKSENLATQRMAGAAQGQDERRR